MFRLSAGLGLSLAAEHNLALDITVFDMPVELDFQKEVSRVCATRRFVLAELRNPSRYCAIADAR